MNNLTSKTKRGFSLIEMIIYIAILVVILLSVINMMLILSKSYGRIKVERNIMHSTTVTLERMTREIKGAKTINVAGSIFNLSPGKLVLDGIDSFGNATTTTFYVVGNSLHVMEGISDKGPIISTQSRIDNLIFRRIASSSAEAVKIEMSIGGGSGIASSSRKIYMTVTLRNNY
ncbi:MAG: prepilin-type N-terminal cleavage/methylation domain-containing protein [Candidatus Paceibacterota bacterium]